MGGFLQWRIHDSPNLSQHWIFERYSLQNGDINTDGIIDSTDTEMLFGYINGSVTLNERQIAFADINGDGSIRLADTSRLHYFVNGKIEIP